MTKTKITVRLPGPLPEAVKNAAYWLRKPAEQIYADAIEQHIKRLETEHNEGHPFPEKQAA